MDEAAALEALSDILNKLTENPYDISLHVEHVRIARATGMEDQVESALDMVTAFWAVGDQVWLPLIERKQQSSDLESPADLQEVLTLFKRAEQDYLSIPILQKHLEFLMERRLFSPEWMHEAISEVVTQGNGHLTKSHLLWDVQRDWELELLQNSTASDKTELVNRVENMLLDRLQQPHSNHEETLQTYSSFTTNYKPPDQYELLLIKASKSRSQAVKSYDRRESYENSLAQTGFSLEGYAYYIASERRAKKPDLFVLNTLYERAISEADKRRFSGESGAEQALHSFWTGYVDFLRTQDVEDDFQLSIYKRALRSAPVSGEVLSRYIRFLERVFDLDDAESEIRAVYENAKAIGPLQSNVEQLIPVIIARAGYEKRRVEAGKGGEEGFNALLEILMSGIVRVRKASPSGDPRLRLEKYFSTICLDIADLAEHAIVDVLIKQRMYDDARKVFRDIAMKNLDWPEAIWEAWVTFEQLHGTVEGIDDCLDRIERAQLQVNARRAKEAQKAEYAAMQLIAEQQAAMPVADVTMQTAPRKAEEDVIPEGSKKPRIEEPARLKRDRENCTVFVADLPVGVQDDELRTLFKDCGAVREIKITQLPNSLVATVEFIERDSVPAALTKDKKQKTDDAFVRNMFEKYGTIFDVRWPSKKFKSTRRFCYVQYTSPSSAEAALELNGHELEEGHSLSVLISNPERKKERTDSDANEREIYVAGLSKFATQQDLEKLFKTYGTVKEVRMALDKDGHSRGFAFVEFEQEKDAMAALSANNYELKKRRIAVTLSDTRFRAKNKEPGYRAEVRNRSVRIRNLPPGTQEGLLQQALEKHAAIKRVEVFTDKNEAEVELENAAEAGKLLLYPDPIVFEGKTLEILAESASGPSGSRSMAPPPTAGGLFVPRTAASRPRAGLGSKKRAAAPIAKPSTSSSSQSAPVALGQGKGQDDFRKMLNGGK
ncbi:hypothetical protein A0H81_11060 [Grifola frondosa]|uniref:RRM domain-containing protein n=1 Tax=Grifola frondosa TaxID=5627 RepID=A0A1C7LVU0_GRIFR|nr:hypothetical protein A0H81_11060 [Grifola frondosa]